MLLLPQGKMEVIDKTKDIDAPILVVECNCGHEFEMALERGASDRRIIQCPECAADSGVTLDQIARSFFAALENPEHTEDEAGVGNPGVTAKTFH